MFGIITRGLKDTRKRRVRGLDKARKAGNRHAIQLESKWIRVIDTALKAFTAEEAQARHYTKPSTAKSRLAKKKK